MRKKSPVYNDWAVSQAVVDSKALGGFRRTRKMNGRKNSPKPIKHTKSLRGLFSDCGTNHWILKGSIAYLYFALLSTYLLLVISRNRTMDWVEFVLLGFVSFFVDNKYLDIL